MLIRTLLEDHRVESHPLEAKEMHYHLCIQRQARKDLGMQMSFDLVCYDAHRPDWSRSQTHRTFLHSKPLLSLEWNLKMAQSIMDI